MTSKHILSSLRYTCLYNKRLFFPGNQNQALYYLRNKYLFSPVQLSVSNFHIYATSLRSFKANGSFNNGKYSEKNGKVKQSLSSEQNKNLNESSSNSTNEVDDEKKLSVFKKFKLMYKQYWYVLIPVHVATSIVWYGSFFFMAKSGLDLGPLLEKIGTSETIVNYIQNGNAGYYGVAYAMYKLATPARYTVTLGCTTVSIKYLTTHGYIKPVPTKKELKSMYEDKKEEFREKREEIKERFEERTDEMRERFNETKERLEDRTDEIREKFDVTKRHFTKRTEKVRRLYQIERKRLMRRLKMKNQWHKKK